MRYKVVPEPRSVDALRAAADAVPLVPGSVEDCCTRVRDGTDLDSRDEARETLTFLQALGLVEESERGFYRVREERSPADLATAFRERVFGAQEVLAAVDDGPASVEDAFQEVRDVVPRWERDRRTDWEAIWRERTRRLLEWAVEFGLAERSDGEYRRGAGDLTG